MKTAEEKAKEYAEETILVLYSDLELMQDFTQKLKKYAKVDFLAGYNEAMRWRNPKVEVPQTMDSVLVKYKTRKGILKYGVGRYLDIGIGNPWTIEGSVNRDVIGWRPIE
jgi:hypothetical protein